MSTLASVDAELDEGNVWEAIADASLQGLGNVMWVVDANRQSLDRVIPDLSNAANYSRLWMGVAAVIAVTVLPGAIALTRMRCGASCRARARVRVTMPPLAAV